MLSSEVPAELVEKAAEALRTSQRQWLEEWDGHRSDVFAYMARHALAAVMHDPRCISLTDSEFNNHCDCRTLAMIDGTTKGPTT